MTAPLRCQTGYTIDDLRKIVPAAFAGRHQMSERYSQVKTSKVVEILLSSGFVCVAAKQDKPTKRNPLFVTHTLTFRREEFVKERLVLGEAFPDILVTNSHNGRTKFSMRAGLFRLICTNGLIVGEEMSSERFTHIGVTEQTIIDAANRLQDYLEKLSHRMDTWKKIELSPMQRLGFAREALSMRFGDRAQAYDAGKLLEPRRASDAGNDLWRTFNVVQENCVQGGVEGQSSEGRAVRSRALTSILPAQAFNAGLWALADRTLARVAA